MKRKTWKWLFGISLTLLVLLILFTFALWIMVNVAGVLMYMLAMGNIEIREEGISFGEFFANFIGSPLFYMYLVNLFALFSGIIGLVATKKRK